MTDQLGHDLAPDENGILKPVTTTPLALLSEDERLLHRSVNSGGSGRGGSFWSGASRCGRRAILSERKYAFFRESQSTLPILKNHFLVGSLYHTMQEAWRSNDPPYDDPSFRGSFANVNVQEAARLFQGYVGNWDRVLWGETLGIEKQLPTSADKAGEVFGLFGAELTGKIDMVVELQPKHLAAARERLPELLPGRYIVDFKTAEMPGTGAGYIYGLQSIIYPMLWNLCFPEQRVLGTIFDVIYKRSRRKPAPLSRSDFGAYFAPYDVTQSTSYQDQLKGMVQQGKFTTDNFLPNRSECCSWRGELCQFFQKECNAEV